MEEITEAMRAELEQLHVDAEARGAALEVRCSYTPRSSTRNRIPGTNCADIPVSWMESISGCMICSGCARCSYDSPTHPEINLRFKQTQTQYNLYEECVFLCLDFAV
eukprot:2977341-Rhodomonas_salina.2